MRYLKMDEYLDSIDWNECTNHVFNKYDESSYNYIEDKNCLVKSNGYPFGIYFKYIVIFNRYMQCDM